MSIDEWENGKDFKANISNLGNGTYKIEFTAFKTGDLVGVMLHFTDSDGTTSLPVSLLEKKDVPELITIMPGDCDSDKSTIRMSHLQP